MLTSKQVLSRTGISRATLNNYITLGILPKPVLAKGEGRTRRIGHFEPGALITIQNVNALKKRGHSIAEIVDILNQQDADVSKSSSQSLDLPNESPERRRGADRRNIHESSSIESIGGNGLRLTIDQVMTPAYMVNTRFELEWSNEQAAGTFSSINAGLASEIADRSVFGLIFRDDMLMACESRDEIISFHLSIAKNRMTRTAILTADPELDEDNINTLGQLYDNAEPAPLGQVLHIQANLAPRGEEPNWFDVYASTFREGFFIVYMPVADEDDQLMKLLARRDIVIRDLLKRRRPYLTPVAVIVADLQDSVKICAELPPEEYFELINDIWGAMEPKLRQYYATHGKHVGDGMVYYFFPQPDSNYAMNALLCAEEMKTAMRDVSKLWKKKKNWANDLVLNIGLHEGQEWFGTYQTPTHVEVTVLGDTINMAARLSDFAREGSVWISKAMFGQLSSKERDRVSYGVKRRSEDGSDILVPSTYSRISNLLDLDNPKFDKFRDIAAMAVTEIIDVEGTE
ncbi:MAG: MerR family transcriptional regulator [Rhodospirillaceae bacterium]|jgi:adenylate cyclase|nr:MerR family transcriptional regulator [Rhodospirillaceae bacterium]MBT4219367.1 MerR family transcriptional regulator [Rhodospirillaceae bacterium]MBT4463820.1 MerR family transcriptional regulator [Rhodospirillaceae bacterium]MBT7355273.1 MerR family transcriptional regulator [Rhodospirillaceae bacterium]